jgi:hypothetical protein
MKKLIIAAVVVLSMSVQAFAVGITVQCKAHYDGSDCKPATKGVCIIIKALPEPSSDSFNGDMIYDRSQSSIVLTFSKSKDMTQTTFASYFNGGTFLIDADSPVSPNVLKSIYYPYSSLTINQGKYQYTVNGDIITVVIPTVNSAISK